MSDEQVKRVMYWCTECESLCHLHEQGLACACDAPWETEVVHEKDYPDKWVSVVISVDFAEPGADQTVTQIVEPQPQFKCQYREESVQLALDPNSFDTWVHQEGRGLVCSCCGSIHPEAFLEHTRVAALPFHSTRIEPLQRGDKIFIHEEGKVPGAYFMMVHSPPTEGFVRAVKASFDNAVKHSNEKWQQYQVNGYAAKKLH